MVMKSIVGVDTTKRENGELIYLSLPLPLYNLTRDTGRLSPLETAENADL